MLIYKSYGEENYFVYKIIFNSLYILRRAFNNTYNIIIPVSEAYILFVFKYN
jgi:hypothetical protein